MGMGTVKLEQLNFIELSSLFLYPLEICFLVPCLDDFSCIQTIYTTEIHSLLKKNYSLLKNKEKHLGINFPCCCSSTFVCTDIYQEKRLCFFIQCFIVL